MAVGRAERRGSQAVEFALLLPVLSAILLGTVEYGWYFWRESLVTNALRDAVRAGSYQAPTSNEATGQCSACLTKTAQVARASLAGMGITVTQASVTPTIANVSGTCAIVLQPSIPYEPLLNFVPTPTYFGVRLVGFAQSVSGC